MKILLNVLLCTLLYKTPEKIKPTVYSTSSPIISDIENHITASTGEHDVFQPISDLCRISKCKLGNMLFYETFYFMPYIIKEL